MGNEPTRETTPVANPPPRKEEGAGKVINAWMFRWAGAAVEGVRPLCVLYMTTVDGEDLRSVTTAAICRHDGRRIETVDGKKYCLGLPHQRWVAWLNDKGFQLNEADPLNFDQQTHAFIVMGPNSGEESQNEDNPFRPLLTADTRTKV